MFLEKNTTIELLQYNFSGLEMESTPLNAEFKFNHFYQN